MKFWYQCLGCGTLFSKEQPKREHLLEEEWHDCSGSRTGSRYRAVHVKITEDEEIRMERDKKLRRMFLAECR